MGENIVFVLKEKLVFEDFGVKRKKKVFSSSKQAATGDLREVEQAAAFESSGVGGFAKQGRNQIWFPGEARRRRFQRSSAGGAVFDEVRKLQRRWSVKKTGGKHRRRPSVM
ncbi:hypothetical protein U1Q18_011314 [Sarracenia purpurea var. burkii]